MLRAQPLPDTRTSGKHYSASVNRIIQNNEDCIIEFATAESWCVAILLVSKWGSYNSLSHSDVCFSLCLNEPLCSCVALYVLFHSTTPAAPSARVYASHSRPCSSLCRSVRRPVRPCQTEAPCESRCCPTALSCANRKGHQLCQPSLLDLPAQCQPWGTASRPGWGRSREHATSSDASSPHTHRPPPTPHPVFHRPMHHLQGQGGTKDPIPPCPRALFGSVSLVGFVKQKSEWQSALTILRRIKNRLLKCFVHDFVCTHIQCTYFTLIGTTFVGLPSLQWIQQAATHSLTGRPVTVLSWINWRSALFYLYK